MKKSIVLLVGIVLISLVINSCDKTYEEYTYIANVPVYMNHDDFRDNSKIKSEAPQAIINPGKIYFKGGKLFISESFKGIHVIDNTNPANPIKVAFLNIPGNVDIAIKGNTMYVDSYIDLLAIDISDLNNIAVVKRIENVFAHSIPPFNKEYPVAPLDHTKGVVVDWKIEKITVKEEINNRYYNTRWGGMLDGVGLVSSGKDITYFVPNSVGIAGSMARFIIHSDYLYSINEEDVKLFNISSLTNPVEGDSFNTNRVIETLFVYNGNLYIGSTTGMLVYSLTNPAAPVYLSRVDHFTSCDPVVAQGDYAYVTLRAGSGCRNNTRNQLDVVDITDINNPALLKSYNLAGPYGLGIDNGVLFICDGDAGLKVYDATDPLKIDENMISAFPGIKAFDIIPYNYIAMMIGSDGLYQYDYHDLENLVLLSVISTEKK